MTVHTLLVLQALLRDPSQELYGLQISAETGLLPGTTYPILLRLENAGWVTSRVEDIDPRTEKRPARRYYSLTASGTPSRRVRRRPPAPGGRQVKLGGGPGLVAAEVTEGRNWSGDSGGTAAQGRPCPCRVKPGRGCAPAGAAPDLHNAR
ncbi:MAG TPA: PadR family transcriptional regulator [Streptosporangiaceae bacterium]|nr:PadR family transcriptional regulator [Streptosporangiaceae bacterium]